MAYLGNISGVPDFNNFLTTGGIVSERFTIISSPVKGKNGEVSGANVNANTRESDAPWQIVYGLTRVGGVFTFITTDQPNGGEYIYVVQTIAGHKISAIDKLFLDDTQVDFGGSIVTPGGNNAVSTYAGLVYLSANLGDSNQSALSDLVSDSNSLFPGQWTESHKQRGRAHVFLKMKFQGDVFPNGFPKIIYEIRGKPVYDPRTGLTVYSNNAALCILDYLINTDYGLGESLATDIDVNNFIEAANICDETITLRNSGTEARYTCNGFFDVSKPPRNILEDLTSCIAGSVTYFGGQWRCFPGAWRQPTITLIEDDLRSELSVRTHNSKRDSFNAVRGSYIGPDTNWQESEYPQVRNSLYETEDAELNYVELSYPLVTSTATVQRLGKIELERIRQGITVELSASLKLLQAQVQDNIYVTLSRFGWSAKPFLIEDLSLKIDSADDAPLFHVDLVLRETASTIWDWNGGQETTVDLAPNTNLPSPLVVVSPTDVTLSSGTTELYLRSDGTVFSRIKVSWTPPADPFVRTSGQIQIQYKKSSDTLWQDASAVPGDSTFTFILDVKDGDLYDVRIRSVNGIGVASSWVTRTGHQVIGKTAPPSNVSGFSVIVDPYSVRFNWNSVTDLDLKHYEIRYGVSGSSWDSATLLAEVRGTSYTWNAQLEQAFTFLIRAVDTSGNKSAIPTSYNLSIFRPGTPVVSLTIEGENMVLQWSEVSSQFSILDYQISYGATFSGSVIVNYTKATRYSQRIDWTGNRRFYVIARDVARNNSNEAVVDVVVQSPSQVQGLTAQIVDNNALLRWNEPTIHTLPVDHYLIYKGATFGTATLIGEASGTFAAVFETTSGTYQYWVVAVDSAGNVSTEVVVSAVISQPPDYVLRFDTIIDPDDADTLTNIFNENGSMIAPVYTTETWNDHFANRSWTTIQNQIDSGYPIYIHPANSSNAVFEEVLDYGTALPGTLITFTWSEIPVYGSTLIVPKMSHSLDNSTWTDFNDVTQIFASNFRYLKVRLTISSSSGTTGLVRIQEPRVILTVKIDEDGGEIQTVSTDVSGTIVLFNKSFIDIDRITLSDYYYTIDTTKNPIKSVADFTDVPNPVSFRVYSFDKNGTRVSARVSWTAKGILRV